MMPTNSLKFIAEPPRARIEVRHRRPCRCRQKSLMGVLAHCALHTRTTSIETNEGRGTRASHEARDPGKLHLSEIAYQTCGSPASGISISLHQAPDSCGAAARYGGIEAYPPHLHWQRPVHLLCDC